MTMKQTSLLAAFAFTGAVLSSCVYYTPPVADMPYKNNPNRPVFPNTWMTQPPAAAPAVAATAPIPAPKPVAAPAPKPAVPKPVTPPAPKPAPKPAPTPAPADKPLDLTNPGVTIAPEPAKPIVTPAPLPMPEPPAPEPAPAPKPEPAPAAAAKPAASASTASAGADPKSITNQGPIPVATRVEGDPTRVYNPLDPSKTIRVTDKTGKPFPSGKELKVRGTNFHFYVP